MTLHTELSVLIVEDDLAMQLGCVQALQLAGLRALSLIHI